MEKENEKTDFDELIVISPPKMLGDIRGFLSKQVLPKVTTEIPKDISKFSEAGLVPFLEKNL